MGGLVYRTTLPYGGITRIRFGGSFSPRSTNIPAPKGPLTCTLTLMELWDNCNHYPVFSAI